MIYTSMPETFSKVLVAEDDNATARAIRRVFEKEGAQVTITDNGHDAASFMQSEDFLDVAILDVTMPGLDGVSLVQRMREFGCHTPVIMVSGSDSVRDRVRGLEAGADDYMGKPFNAHELMIRAKALCRRVQRGGNLPKKIQVGKTFCDFETHTAQKEGEPVHLTPLEWKVLRHLAFRKGHAVSRAEFNVRVLKIPHDLPTRTIDRHAYALRCKLDEDPLNPQHILKVHGVGYRLNEFTLIEE
ncbi:MAG: response regulator transcription factor [Bacteroidetes bacterium]|nr:response regulator transcription factor [Bacteroidota bacterium]MCY4205150.1 response regulator transcription factor [Bacteroidota bacterium]